MSIAKSLMLLAQLSAEADLQIITSSELTKKVPLTHVKKSFHRKAESLCPAIFLKNDTITGVFL